MIALTTHPRALPRAVQGLIARRQQPFLRRRSAIARRFLAGSGIEIGGLNAPLEVPRTAHVRYVDRIPVAELRQHYPELARQELVEPHILDDGERLEKVADASQDFVIANHFLEHCENPIGALVNMFRVLVPAGILYLAVPDKRFTFDRERPRTPIDHLVDHLDRPNEVDRRAHFEEWVRLVDGIEDDSTVVTRVDALMERGYSIHFHVWDQVDIFEVLLLLRGRFGVELDVELAVRNQHENVFVLRKLPPGRESTTASPA